MTPDAAPEDMNDSPAPAPKSVADEIALMIDDDADWPEFIDLIV